MALKRKNKIETSFSMSSMTDVIFLLLIFFMVTSTVVFPNAIKVLLPQSKKQQTTAPSTRVTIDADLNYYVAYGNERERAVAFDDITPFLQQSQQRDPDMYVAIYADESVPYREVVKVLNVGAENNFKMVIATRPLK
jgi:biopolymer transport protein ExbD